MRILIIFPPYMKIPTKGYGGIEKVAYERAYVLTKMGFKVDVVVPAGSKVEFAKNAYSIPLLPIQHKHKDISSIRNPLSKSLEYVKFLRDTKAFTYGKIYSLIAEEINFADYDVIIDDAFRYEPWNIYLFAKMSPWKKTIHIIHTGMPIFIKIPIRLPLKIMLGALNSQLYELLKRKNYIAFHLPNGILIPENRKPRESIDYLLFMGRVSPSKGSHLAIRIARRLKKKLIIAGPVHDKEYFATYIKPWIDGKEIMYVGSVAGVIKEELLSKPLALVYTSLSHDNYPTVLLEALSWGVPIVALYPPRPSGFYDIVDERFCVCGNTIEEIAKNFEKIYSIDRKDVLRYARENLSWEAVIKTKWLPVINWIAEGSKT